MTSIKEHIEAGHYPKDEKGRALVPQRAPSGEWVALIYATDLPGKWPILGRSFKRSVSDNTAPMQWDANGVGSGSMHEDWHLLPPPPRKVKVTAWASAVRGGTLNTLQFHKCFAERDAEAAGEGYRVVELTGEYEEPWP